MAEKRLTLNLDLPGIGYRRRMFFNRFDIEKLESQILLRFGLMRESHGPLLDSFSCIIDEIDLDSNRDRLLNYLPLLEHVAPVKVAPWIPSFEPATIEVVTMINLAQAKDAAEILFGTYSMHSAVTVSRTAGKLVLQTDPIALLRCHATLQKAFLTKLSKFL